MKNFDKYFEKNPKTDAFLISKPENIFYLTEFQGSFGYLLILRDGKKLLITDSRYANIAEKLCKNTDTEFFLFDKNFKENIKNKIPRIFKKMAIENVMTIAQKDYWQEIFPDINIESVNKIIDNWRSIKSTNEIQKIRKACDKLNDVFDDVDFFRGILTAGITEKEAAFQLEMKLRENGKYELSFPIIVAFGENSAIPHHSPSERELIYGDNILIDCGVIFDNYCSDMTRNFSLGNPSNEFKDCFDKLLATQIETVKEFKIAEQLIEADKFCRNSLGNSAKYFTHSLGHGVGIEIHELPNFSKEKENIFMKNQIITCEPGLYFAGKFGIRIEDQILITADGPEILTKTPKELIIL